MNFWTFLACVVLIIIWHVVHLIYKFFEVFISGEGTKIANEYYAKRYAEFEFDYEEAKAAREKKTIGFQTTTPINEKEES